MVYFYPYIMLSSIIAKILKELAELLESGNSELSQTELLEVFNTLDQLVNKERPLSKEAASKYLNVSRSQFDNYVKDHKIPQGKKVLGFKELSWTKNQLDLFIKSKNVL